MAEQELRHRRHPDEKGDPDMDSEVGGMEIDQLLCVEWNNYLKDKLFPMIYALSPATTCID